MKLKIIFVFTIGLAFLISCTKDDGIEISDDDYLIFGHFYGECFGENCVETFKLTENKIFEDLNDNYSGTDNFSFVELNNTKFIGVSDLTNYFPNELITDGDSTYGCPDCADQGGLIILLHTDGDTKSWRIDQRKVNIPEYLHEFVDKVNEKITFINE